MSGTLTDLVVDAAQQNPVAVALRMGSSTLTYAELVAAARGVATSVPDLLADEVPLVLLWDSHDPATYVGVLGALLAGRGYVPLSPDFPDARLHEVVKRSGARVLLVAAADRQSAEHRLAAAQVALHVVSVVYTPATVDVATPVKVPSTPDDLAYLLFTSGSTGTPKGVAITHRNVVPLINYMVDFYGLGPDDVCSQVFGLSFDLSVHCMFTTWAAGATLAVPDQRQRMMPGAFIRKAMVSVWYSVPSVTDFMRRTGQLKPGLYPGLRSVLFCGAPLTRNAAIAWQAAAPHAVVDNHYGPTECTITVTGFRCDSAYLADSSAPTVVPIGTPYPNVSLNYADADLNEVLPGETGELLLGGPQLASGYWKDPEKSAAAFVRVPWLDEVVYRTGDRVRRPLSEDEPVHYLGRLDNQVKILGFRIELGEIEANVQALTNVDAVAALGWPETDEGYGGLELFVGDESISVDMLLGELRERLPSYMVPHRVHLLAGLPLNSNGKTDRHALKRLLEATHDPIDK